MSFRPAEWDKNWSRKIILAWPYDESLWQENLPLAQQEFLDLVAAIAPQKVLLLVPGLNEEKQFLNHYQGSKDNLEIIHMAYSDIWLRDTLPIWGEKNKAIIPKFNGWGHKYLFKSDADLAVRMAKKTRVKIKNTHLTFEGGSIDTDGVGTLLTTSQCLLNDNRNKGFSKEEVEKELLHIFDCQKILWLKDGLENDHTDGHIDTLARFIDTSTIAIMKAANKEDPNCKALKEIKTSLQEQTDAKGQKISLVEIPSPGKVVCGGEIVPASYLNFIFTQQKVIVPQYGSPFDEEALRSLKAFFSSRFEVVGLSAKAIITGGGAFHCISQELFY